MQQIIFFFIRNKNFLLFGLLFVISIMLTIQSHSYHKNKFISSSNFFTGKVFTFRNSITDYFGLGKENQRLVEENLRLRQKLENFSEEENIPFLDTLVLPKKYKYYTATVINNNYSRSKNHITLNKGSIDSLKVDMGVISGRGLVGIVSDVSENYATVQSILNTKSRINAKLKKSNHFGSLIWDAKSPHLVQLNDIPRIADIKVGDTVVTGGRSTIFPEGIPIGAVKDFRLDKDDNYYYVNLEVFNDLTSLQHVYLIQNNHAQEILTLEKEAEDAE